MQTLVKTLSDRAQGDIVNSYGPDEETKRCPYCAEVILAAAIKCKHCSEFLNGASTPPPVPPAGKKWHQSNTTIILALLTMGPLALPMVWMNKRYSMLVKVIISTVVIGVTVAVGYAIIKLFQNTFNQIKAMGINGI